MSIAPVGIKALGLYTSLVAVVSGVWACSVYGVSGAQLQSIIDEVSIKKIPGILLVVDGPTISFSGSRGYANRKTRLPISVGHSLRTGSISKTYVAALTVMASIEGLIDLDESIENYLDSEELKQLPDKLRPTVRQLLNHTSGVPDYYGARFYMRDWKDRGPLTTELVFHAIRGKSATGTPGEKFAYSNTNYHLVALILESVYGMPLEALLTERIFKPLNLTTTYYNQRFPPGDLVHGYGSPFRPWVDTYEWQENTGPDGGIIASAGDLAKWVRALFSDRGLYEGVGKIMSANPVLEKKRKYQGMGVEILVSRTGSEVFGHTGDIDGYLTAAFYAPATDNLAVLHMNRSSKRIFASTLSQILRLITDQPDTGTQSPN